MEGKTYNFRLYISGNTPNSLKALENLQEVCSSCLEGRYELEVVDIFKEPHLAARDKVFAIPTLVKEAPPPVRRIIGHLSNRDEILAELDLVTDDRDR